MMTRSFTARGVQLQMGETTTYRHAGYRTVVTPVLLASPLKQHPAGTVIGRVQRREYSGGLIVQLLPTDALLLGMITTGLSVSSWKIKAESGKLAWTGFRLDAFTW
jgi:hypothetical protein